MISFKARVWAIVRAVARGGVWSTDGAVACTLAIFLRGLVTLPLGLVGAGCGGEPPAAAPGGAPVFRQDLVARDGQSIEERAANDS